MQTIPGAVQIPRSALQQTLPASHTVSPQRGPASTAASLPASGQMYGPQPQMPCPTHDGLGGAAQGGQTEPPTPLPLIPPAPPFPPAPPVPTLPAEPSCDSIVPPAPLDPVDAASLALADPAFPDCSPLPATPTELPSEADPNSEPPQATRHAPIARNRNERETIE